MVEQRRADEEALFMPLQAEAAPVDDQLGALFGAFRDPAFDLFLVRLCHHGAVMGIGIGRYADAQRLDRGDQLVAQPLRRILAHRHDHGQRHAAFARRAEGGAGQVAHHLVEIGVGHDDTVILRAAHRLHPLARAHAAFIDIMGDVRRADEADRRDVGMIEDGIDHFLVTVDDLENPLGASRLRGTVRPGGREPTGRVRWASG